MLLVDTHCHLHDMEFFGAEEAEAAWQRARAEGVTQMICVSTRPDDAVAARDFAKRHDGVYWTYGIHPAEWRADNGGDFELDEKLVAIGEVGLDYHYGLDERTQQIKLFERMLELAVSHNLPVSFHVREAFDDFFGMIQNVPHLRGVVHSFTDSKKNLRRILEETDLLIGVNGLATYTTLPLPPLERLILETDAPFLAPVSLRGTKNEPKNIRLIAEWLAVKLDVSLEQVAERTTENATKLFLLK